MSLCCGRCCGLWTGPLKRYAEAFTAQRFLPDLAITNHMNHEAILQVFAFHSICSSILKRGKSLFSGHFIFAPCL